MLPHFESLMRPPKHQRSSSEDSLQGAHFTAQTRKTYRPDLNSAGSRKPVGSILKKDVPLNALNAEGTKSCRNKSLFLCPELFASYQTEIMVQELLQESYHIRYYDGGRIEISFGSEIEETYLEDIALTEWSNGDFKLFYMDQVYYWHAESKYLDKYFVTQF